jgi:preprotein translocase subunit SecD
MKKNLTNKILLIIAVMVVCILGIVGVSWIPLPGTTPKPILQAMTDRIHLGLDLRGGAHLILQVKVEEAVNAETDNTVALISQELKTANLGDLHVYKPDPAKVTLIRVEGAAEDKSNDVRLLLESNKFANEYDVASGDVPGSFTLTMKPLFRTSLEKQTVTQAIEAIRDRVDALGISEPQIQEYGLGENQILVDLPGVENESQIESIIQGTNRRTL